MAAPIEAVNGVNLCQTFPANGLSSFDLVLEVTGFWLTVLSPSLKADTSGGQQHGPADGQDGDQDVSDHRDRHEAADHDHQRLGGAGTLFSAVVRFTFSFIKVDNANTVGIGYCDYLGTWPKQSQYPLYLSQGNTIYSIKNQTKAGK